MGYSTTDGATGKGLGSFTTTPSTASDLNKGIELIGRMGNRRAGTNAARVALTGSNLYDGLVYFETDTLEEWARLSGAWVRQSKPWTDFTPSWAGLVLGTGGSTTYAKYKIDNGEATVAVGVVFGSSGMSWADPSLTPPVAIASWFVASTQQIGGGEAADDSVGAAGRYALFCAVGAGSVIRVMRHMSPLTAITNANLFAPALSDQLHIYATYPV